MEWRRAKRRYAACAVLAACVALALLLAPAQALRYRVDIAATGDAELDAALRQVSILVRLRTEQEQPDAAALVARARGDAGRLREAARSLGYYGAEVAVRIASRGLDDPDLPPELERGDQTREVAVEVAVTPGRAYRLRRVGVDSRLPPGVTPPTLAAGGIARAADIIAAATALQDALRQAGHGYANVEARDVVVDHGEGAVDVTFSAVPGPVVTLGEIRVEGLERVREDFVRRRLGIAPGDRYDPRRIELARRDLAQVGVFATVRSRLGEQPDANGSAPLILTLNERQRRTITLGAAYATDEGLLARGGWQHRNLFGRAESIALSLEVSRLLRNAPDRAAGRLEATFRKPDIFRRNLALRVDFALLRERPTTYDRDAVTAGIGFERRFSERLTGSAGIAAEQARITENGVTRNITVFALPASLAWDSSDDLLNPTRGRRWAVNLAPATVTGDQQAGFVAARARASAYFDLGAQPGRRVLAVRAAIGTVVGAPRDSIPADRRLYAGGGGSVRGYAFQTVGPRNALGRPLGGRSLVEASVELRQRIGASWGAVVFADLGAVGERAFAFGDRLRVGIGAGVRYYTAIGPIRLDIAVPLDRDPGTGAWQLYIGIGQAF